jgi:hypothetical protein
MEAIMSEGEMAMAIVFLIALVFGVVVGVVLIVSVASNREDKRKSLRDQAPDAACDGVRKVVGAGTRGAGWAVAGHSHGDEDPVGPGGGPGVNRGLFE